jgi:FkbM family methyltransferase
MNYYNQILEHKAFKDNRLYVLWNAISLFFCLFFRISFIFRVTTKFVSFRLYFQPLNKNMGGRGIFLYREKIEPLMEYGLKFIRKNDICIDAGANQGIYTIPFGKIVGPGGQVVAIEPMKYAQIIIKENSKLNNLKNIKIFNGVVSDKNKKETLDFSNGVGSASITRDFGKKKILKVNSKTIDNLVKNYNIKKVNFIKMDIEGCEFLALQGARKTIQKFKPIICLECDVKGFKKINNFLKKFSYKAYLFDNNGSLFKIDKIRKDQSNIFFYT